MRIHLFTSIATCVLALGLAGCRVQSTIVMPNGGTLPYAAPGQTLEWRPLSPMAPPMYIVFNGVSPCAEPYYPIGSEPVRCKVLKDHNGYFSYRFEKEKPDPRHLFARSCPYCQIYIGPGSTASAGPSNASVSNGSDESKDGTGYPPLQVGCESGVAVVENPIQSGVQDQDQIFWVPSYPGKTVMVTTHNNMCTGGTNGVFTADQACTVTGPPSTSGQPPITYTYEVKLDNCRQGSGTLTINPSQSTTATAQ